jgi:hypothetical protein
MRAVRLGRCLTVVVTLSLTLLIASMIGLGAAIRYGVVAPPTLDIRLSLIRIAAYSTHYPECSPSMQCPPQSVAPPEEYYVVWLIHEPTTAEQPNNRIVRRMLVALVQR